MDPYNADDSREEEEVNDEDNSLQGDASPTIVLPNRKDYYPKGLPWMPKITERDAELFNKPSCSKLIGYTLGNVRSTVVGAAQTSL